MSIRYVHKTYGRYSADGCHACGSYYANTQTTHMCDATECLGCGLRQCMSHGLGHGACGICLTGILIGWSGYDRKTCGYKNCSAQAVSEAPRVRYVCADHYERAYKRSFASYRAEALATAKAVEDGAYRYGDKAEEYRWQQAYSARELAVTR